MRCLQNEEVEIELSESHLAIDGIIYSKQIKH